MKSFVFVLLILVEKASTFENFDSAYLVFIGSNYNDYQILRNGLNLSEVVSENYFNVSRPSVFITHGWRDGFLEEFGKVMVEAYLARNDCNIIFGDWSFYSPHFNYMTVAESVPGLARIFLKYLYKIKESGYDLSRIHFVGHSLGAHVFGKIGELLKADNIFLSRITGLDPAGPTFNKEIVIKIFLLTFKIPSNPGLRKGNARFVDVIHSDAGLTGTTASTGDLDFWPNAGWNQPSCISCPSKNGDEGVDCISCNHRTSWRYFAESVRSSTPIFMSLRCSDDVTEYTENNCKGPETASMGYYADVTSKSGNYYAATNAAAPFSR